MPELPDVVVYVDALRRFVVGRRLERIRLKSPFLLRSVTPPLALFEGRLCTGAERLGKRLVLAFEPEGAVALFLVIHPMIAGRLKWRKPGAGLPGRIGLAAFDWPHGTLLLTEASQKKRAALFAVQGRAGLAAHARDGLDVRAASSETFAARLRARVHTLKRALCDPTLFDGIGNAYSDEILHRAKLSPLRRTDQLDDAEVARLHAAAKDVLAEWIERLSRALGDGFPEQVTAFHPEMSVHGKHKAPCPVCGAPIQRIVRTENELNYCPGCQTGGRILKDRALSDLLKESWPRSLEEL